MCVLFFFCLRYNSYLSTVQIVDSFGLRQVQVDPRGSGCAGLPEIYRNSSILRGERGKYAIRFGRTVWRGIEKKQVWVRVVGAHTDMLKRERRGGSGIWYLISPLWEMKILCERKFFCVLCFRYIVFSTWTLKRWIFTLF